MAAPLWGNFLACLALNGSHFCQGEEVMGGVGKVRIFHDPEFDTTCPFTVLRAFTRLH
jgi:hypothetical protein